MQVWEVKSKDREVKTKTFFLYIRGCVVHVWLIRVSLYTSLGDSTIAPARTHMRDVCESHLVVLGVK